MIKVIKSTDKLCSDVVISLKIADQKYKLNYNKISCWE